jgi:hypothetical protein
MKIVTNLLFIVFIFSFVDSKAIDTLSTKYFPIHIGNTYVYDYTLTGTIGNEAYTVKAQIVRDTMINNFRYYLAVNFPNFLNGWVRTDSITGSLYVYDPSNSCSFYQNMKLIDSLSAIVQDSIRNCSIFHLCLYIHNFNIFGIESVMKTFGLSYFNGSWSRRYVKNFGLIAYVYSFDAMGYHVHYDYKLRGCVVNGIVYGDTNTVTVGINSENNFISGYALHQNYPNPFNPSTSIKFDIAKPGYVSLKVFDALGKEVSNLVNENLSAGSYVYSLNASGLPSGIYYYSIKKDYFNDIRKMVLVK